MDDGFYVAVGKEVTPKTVSINIRDNSAVLFLGGYTYDLRQIDFSKYEAIEIDGIRFVKEVE